MPTLTGKTALVTGASRGMGPPVRLRSPLLAPRFSCTTAAARMKPTVLSQENLGASSGERKRTGAAHAARSAGNESGFACQSGHDHRPCCCWAVYRRSPTSWKSCVQEQRGVPHKQLGILKLQPMDRSQG